MLMEIKLLFFRVAHAFKHQLKAVNAHGLHSPFMYNLYKSAFRCKGNKPLKKEYKAAFKSLHTFYRTFPKQHVQSIGAVTKVMHTAPSELLKQTKLNAKDSLLLAKMIKHLSLTKGLELGTSVGLSSVFFGSRLTSWTTIEGNSEVFKWFKSFLEKNPTENIVHKQANFNDFFKVHNTGEAFDFVFIDGDHTLSATLENIERVKPLLSDNALVVLDDISWTSEMYTAWEKIKNDPFFGYTAETNRLGFLFKRDVHVKQHFFLRY